MTKAGAIKKDMKGSGVSVISDTDNETTRKYTFKVIEVESYRDYFYHQYRVQIFRRFFQMLMKENFTKTKFEEHAFALLNLISTCINIMLLEQTIDRLRWIYYQTYNYIIIFLKTNEITNIEVMDVNAKRIKDEILTDGKSETMPEVSPNTISTIEGNPIF